MQAGVPTVSTIPTIFSDSEQYGSRENSNADPLAIYDEPEAWALFSHCDADTQSHAVESFVVVKGMRCAGCALSLERVLLGIEGVQSVQVSAASASARITWNSDLTRPSVWMAAGVARGFELLPAENALSLSDDRQLSRLALWRWLVAGFCMMQVMMYAAPTYFTEPGEVTPDITQLLRWASWVLSLPVVVFSCKPFFSSAWRSLVQRSISMDLPVAIGIVVTFAVSTAATLEPLGWWGGEVYFDSLTMFVFFLLTGRWLEQRLRTRTAGALGALMQRLPASVLRQTSIGVFHRVALRRLAVGDVVRVLPGEAFPADGVVLEGSTFADEALMTGESKPVKRGQGALVMAGSYNVGSAVLQRIDTLGLSTRYAQIVALMERAAVDKPRLAVLADKVAKPFLIFVLLAAAGAAAFWWQTDPARALMAAVAVLIVTCPCALSLATPVSMLTTAGLLARHGVLVRRLQAIESLAGIDTVIFDKTGTLTESTMQLRGVETRAGIASEQALQWAISLAVHSLHPVSKALVAASGSVAPMAASKVTEQPGQGVKGWLDGINSGPDGWLRLGSESYCGAVAISAAIDTNEPGLQVHLANSNGWIATFTFDETLRPEAVQAVQALQARGLKIHILSGDTPAAVRRIANRLQIADAQGACLPADKLSLMQALQAQGRKVWMVGDGLNDGPTLAAAHVSAAVGAAVPLAQAKSDFVLPGAQLLMLPAMLDQAKNTLRIVKQNLAWAAVYNACCVPLALSGFLPAWLAGLGMALSSLLVIGNASRLAHFKAKQP